jgi:hypothetical protein
MCGTQTIDNNIAFAGNLWDDGESDVIIMKFNSNNGDTIFLKQYPSENYQTGFQVKEFSDGKLLILGEDADDEGPFLIKTDENGNYLWDKHYGEGNELTTTSFELSENDTFYLLNRNILCTPPGYYIRQLDSAGNVLSLTEYDNGCPTYAIPSQNGGFVGAGVYYPDQPFHSYIFKLNESGIFEWKYDTPWYIDTLYNDQLLIGPAEEMANGDLIVTGYFAGKPWGSYYGIVSKVNAEGEPYWERIYTSTSSTEWDNRLHEIVLTDDGGFAIAGAAYSEDLTEDQNFWLLKLDSMGCLIPGCDTIVTAIMELPFDKAGILVYPNPVTTEAIVQVEIPAHPEYSGRNDIGGWICEITDVSGRIVKQLAVSDLQFAVNGNKLTFPFQKDNLSPGIYMMHIYSDGTITGAAKVIIR